MLGWLIRKYRIWSAKRDLESVFRSLTLNTMQGGLGCTMLYEGEYSIALFTSKPDLLKKIKELIDPFFEEQEALKNGE